ncbi:TPA: hypothetical protein RUX58_004017 [Aeromonas dhakensis]|nr:hypothetical protein [Aeromonas dhakensis]
MVSMDFFRKVVQSELVKTNLQPVVVFLMLFTLAAWLFNILKVEKRYEARQAEQPLQAHKEAYFWGDIDFKKLQLLGSSFLLSVIIFGLHIGTILYGMEG